MITFYISELRFKVFALTTSLSAASLNGLLLNERRRNEQLADLGACR